jgi:hypothetical protein
MMDEVNGPMSTRATTARVGILMVILATGVRIALLVVSLLVMVGALPRTGWESATVIPLLPLEDVGGKIAFGFLVVLLVASSASVWGLWRRETWGWTLSIVAAGSILALDLGWWFAGEPRYSSMVINSIAVFYLNQRELRSVFRV